MKKLSVILACALVALIACTKSRNVHPELGDGNDENITVGAKEVHVEYTRIDHLELQKVVFHYKPAEAQQFEAAEMIKQNDFFELTLVGLLSDTLYYYYYELCYQEGAFITLQNTFHTQAFDTPNPPNPPTPPSDVPEGALNGLFTINANGDQAYFAQGNLQYQASTNTWRFAEYQWDYLGGENANASPTYNGWVDLFNWGTSGYDHGANCYQPWSTSTNPADYYAYGNPSCNLNDMTGKADWGYNAISNGGNEEGLWRVLTYSEWHYLLYDRETPSGIRFVKARVNGINGLIILPDSWNSSVYLFDDPNSGGAYYSTFVSSEDWLNRLQAEGAVFLPNAGNRLGTSFLNSENGDYWSSTRKMDGDFAYDISIQYGLVGHSDNNGDLAQSVRLVYPVNGTGGGGNGGGNGEYTEVSCISVSRNAWFVLDHCYSDGETILLENATFGLYGAADDARHQQLISGGYGEVLRIGQSGLIWIDYSKIYFNMVDVIEEFYGHVTSVEEGYILDHAKVVFSPTVVTVNGEVVKSYEEKHLTMDTQMCLFANDSGGTDSVRDQTATLGKVTFVNKQGNVVANYLPVLDGKGTPCFYNTVSGAFIYHSGSGTPGYQF